MKNCYTYLMIYWLNSILSLSWKIFQIAQNHSLLFIPFLFCTSLIKAILRNGTLLMRCTNLLTFLRHLKKMHKGCLGTFLYHPLLHLEVWQVWLHSATSWNLFQKLLREAQSLQPVVFIHQVWTIISYNTSGLELILYTIHTGIFFKNKILLHSS